MHRFTVASSSLPASCVDHQPLVHKQKARGAGVRCSEIMSPSSEVRSYAITLAIAITIVGPQASGFTINRTNNTLTTTPSIDLSSEQVKDDLKRPNGNKTTEDGNSNKTTTTYKEFAVTDGITKLPDITTKMSPSLAQTTKEIRSTTEDTKIPTISSDTVEVFDSIEDVKDRNNSVKTTGDINGSSVERSEYTLSQPVVNSSETNLPTELTTVTVQIATESDLTGDRSKNKIGANSMSEQIETTKLYDVFEIPSTESVETSTLKIVTDITTTSAVSSPLINDFSQTVSETSFYSNTSSEDSFTPTELSSTLSVADMTQTAIDDSDTKVTEPFWEKYTKYTTIVRKRVTSSEDTQTAKSEDDTMQAETSNTVVNFEKAFNVTPIPSLEKLRVDLLSKTNQPPLNNEVVSAETTTPTVETPTQSMKPPFHKITETVETKRAGFLDNSEKASTVYSTSVTSIVKKENDTEKHEKADGREATNIGSTDFKKVSGTESQSQLAEDEIQEQFLKEEALNNHQENVKKPRDETNKNDGVKVLAEDASNPAAALPTGTEDSLSVQPINHERTKTTLYTLSPNYKPMKKLDVQPAKPFLRDPDDNSWRNESISSLGIVFKPKNSSKSFKEVLKNKTQTEFNNLQEKDTKDDVPDLRVRLEKIAEVRKTKKKKMNKDGEEIYTDYEEGNSAETSSTTKPEFPSILSPAEISKLMNPIKSKTNLELTTPMSMFNNVEVNKVKTMSTEALFKNLGLDPLTTNKPKKFYNIAEYYDTTDEYDADYVTMSKLDLKKFTATPEITKTPFKYSVGPIMTRPTQPNFPERKPTVQYFPPREPQKVNVNNLDVDFERKVNLFTFKDSPNLRPPFVTVPPVPIATEKPESEMRPVLRLDAEPGMRPEFRPDIRPTVKPTDFAKYTQAQMNKNYYLTNAPRMTETPKAFVINDGNLNRGSYIIKHYKDFLNAAVKDNDDERSADFLPYLTQAQPPREVTPSVTEREKTTSKDKDDDYDYDLQFRKEVLSRFVDNFNQNSERFKVDFPILYNSSIVHRKGDDSGRALASSQAFLKRLYNNEGMATKNSLLNKPCESNCDMTVELSPAYELHYYVPEQEEREEPPATGPSRYRL